jgi:RNA polymerase sigma factor (sigma-70 family)
MRWRNSELGNLWMAALRYLERRGVPRDRAQDYVQDAFMRVAERDAGVRAGASAAADSYVVRAALNAYKDDVRVTARRNVREGQWMFLASAQTIEADRLPLQRIEDAQRHEVLWGALAALPAELLWPLLLCDGGDYSDDRAARELGMRVGTLKSRKRRARAAARKNCSARTDPYWQKGDPGSQTQTPLAHRDPTQQPLGFAEQSCPLPRQQTLEVPSGPRHRSSAQQPTPGGGRAQDEPTGRQAAASIPRPPVPVVPRLPALPVVPVLPLAPVVPPRPSVPPLALPSESPPLPPVPAATPPEPAGTGSDSSSEQPMKSTVTAVRTPSRHRSM